MMDFLHTVFYVPIYNLVVLGALYAPGGDIGVAVIAATIVVKVVLLPLSLAATRTQKAMKRIESAVKELKEEHKDDREKQARELLALYKEHGIRPFASIFQMLIQIPFIIALYFVVLHQAFPQVDPSLLYSFVNAENLQTSFLFLGLIDISQKSIILALIAGLTQLAVGFYTVPAAPKTEVKDAGTEFARAMSIQIRFVLPFIIAIVAYTTSGAIAIYFIVSALFTVLQEFYVRKTHEA